MANPELVRSSANDWTVVTSGRRTCSEASLSFALPGTDSAFNRASLQLTIPRHAALGTSERCAATRSATVLCVCLHGKRAWRMGSAPASSWHWHGTSTCSTPHGKASTMAGVIARHAETRAPAGTQAKICRSCRYGPSAWWKSATTTWKVKDSATQRSSTAGGPTATHTHAPTNNSSGDGDLQP